MLTLRPTSEIGSATSIGGHRCGMVQEVTERDPWLVRLVVVLGALGVGWKVAPPPFRAIIWAVVALVIAIITAIGLALGLPISLQDIARLGAA